PRAPSATTTLATPSLHDALPIFTNTRQQGTIELKKHWVGTAGSTTLKIGTAAGGSQTASTAISGADGTTTAKSVNTGAYYVSEEDRKSSSHTHSQECIDCATDRW